MVIKNAIICDSNKFEKLDIKIENSKIVEISKNIDSDNFIDASSLILMPSIVDLNIRPFNKTLNSKTLNRLSEDALKGGVSDILLMPDLTPAIDSETTLEFVNSKSKNANLTNIHISVNALNSEDKLSNISIMIQKGSFGIFTNSDINGNLLRRVFEYSQMTQIPLFCNCMNRQIVLDGVINDSNIAFKLGLNPIIKLAETSEVAKICEIADNIKNLVILQNLTTKKSLDIAKGKKNILKEVSIHHLIANDLKCDDFNTYAKLMPPLRDEDERINLLEALKSGDIDILTSLHLPSSKDLKDLAFSEASFGIDSIKEFFSLSYSKLVKSKDISLSHLSKLISLNPANILKLNSGLIEVGKDANLILVDLNAKYQIESHKSIYQNDELFGVIKLHIINGEIKYDIL